MPLSLDFPEGRYASQKTVTVEASLIRQARHIVWVGPSSFEYCMINPISNGWLFTGKITIAKPVPFFVSYHIILDKQFRTRTVEIKKLQNGRQENLIIERRYGNWKINGTRRVDLERCIDIDLSASPVTNTLPIRRINPQVGESIHLTVAWVKFPSLEVQPFDQSYERLDKRIYRYTSSSGFTARLKVDDSGLVIRYGNIWKQLS